MFFTISHDFFISNQIEDSIKHSSYNLPKDKSITLEEHHYHQVCDFHMLFHFYAIFMDDFNFKLFKLKKSVIHSLKEFFFNSIKQTRFKPPKF